MRLSAFDFHLPPERIAQVPLPERDQSRLLILNRQTQTWEDSRFIDLSEALQPGTVLVFNNTRVFPARLVGHRPGYGGRVEILLLQALEPTLWEAIGKPGRVLREGTVLTFGGETLPATIVRRLHPGRVHIQFHCDPQRLDQIIDQVGSPPLPPYIKRPSDQPTPSDRQRYQTIYARCRGAVAAPTAGLHFTERVFRTLQQRGIECVDLTHHVGYATFQPIRGRRIEDHAIEAERYHIPEQTAERIHRARQERRSVVAVGTTTVRALESAATLEGIIRPGSGTTRLYIYPGYQFKAIDAVLTNFHLPKSSLLILVSAFAGRELVLKAYQHAINQRYRFYSFGDCMLIL